MLPQDLDPQRLEDSIEMLFADHPRLLTHFYDTFFARYPEVRSLFSEADMEMQKEHFFSTLLFAVKHLQHPDIFIPGLEELGKRHYTEYKVLDKHYQPMVEMLLESMATIAGDKWQEELQQQWRLALQLIFEVFKSSAR